MVRQYKAVDETLEGAERTGGTLHGVEVLLEGAGRRRNSGVARHSADGRQRQARRQYPDHVRLLFHLPLLRRSLQGQG